MKQFFDSCCDHRRDICLFAADALSERESVQTQNHLKGCAACRRYFDEIKIATTSFAGWAASLAEIQPSQSAQRRWASAIETAARPETGRQFSAAAAFREWWRDVIRPCRRVWAGLAAVWLVILAGNVSLKESSPVITAKSAVPSPEAIASFRDQQKILAELLADHSAPRDATRQKFFSPKPRTERFEVVAV